MWAPGAATRAGEAEFVEGFTCQQACRLTGCSTHQLRYWDQIELVSPSIQGTGGRPGVRRLYSFRDLVVLRVIRALLDGGMSLQKVRRAYQYLRRNAALDEQLSSVRLTTDGQTIFRREAEAGLVDALRHGQLAFFSVIEDIAANVATSVALFEEERDQFLSVLRFVEGQTAREAVGS